jgi:hypothetical protein
MDVDYIDAYLAGAVVNFKRSGGSVVPAKILGPSERSVDYRTITYECFGTVFLSRGEHASQQAVPGSFCCSYAFVSARLVSCRVSVA